MILIKSLLSLMIFMSLLIGCSNDINDNKPLTKEKETQPNTEREQIDFEIIASEKTLQTNFYEIAFERETTPLFQYLIKKSDHPSEFEQTWHLYGFKKNIPNFAFNENDVFFIGVNESGSCPYKIEDIELTSENNTITILYQNPKAPVLRMPRQELFAIQIDKEISKDIENFIIVQSGVETEVPLEK